MIGLIFAVIFGLDILLFSPCEGQISLPPGGDTFLVLPGEDVTIAWKLDVSITDVLGRWWAFLPKANDTFANIIRDGMVDAKPQYSPGPFTITKPSTLILKNVTIQYNGTYAFTIYAKGIYTMSDVTVFVAEKPTVTLSCWSPITLYEGDDFTCVCRGEGGNPPANVAWYKDGEQIGGTGMEEQALTLSNVRRTVSGTYKCVATSHTLTDELVEVKVILDYPPEQPYFKEKAVIGKTFAITCESNGHPSPRYTIIHNDTKIVSNNRTYTMDVVRYSDAGLYKCIAENKLGNSSTIYYLSILDQLINPTTGISTQKFSTTENSRSANTAANKEDDETTVVVWHVVVSLVSGIIIGILLSYIVSCSRRKFRSRKPQSNPEPKTTEVDATYQELDLSKMNTEDNYQSLRVNAASYDAGNRAGNDDDSTYTELSKTRDVEDNYQSLT